MKTFKILTMIVGLTFAGFTLADTTTDNLTSQFVVADVSYTLDGDSGEGCVEKYVRVDYNQPVAQSDNNGSVSNIAVFIDENDVCADRTLSRTVAYLPGYSAWWAYIAPNIKGAGVYAIMQGTKTVFLQDYTQVVSYPEVMLYLDMVADGPLEPQKRGFDIDLGCYAVSGRDNVIGRQVSLEPGSQLSVLVEGAEQFVSGYDSASGVIARSSGMILTKDDC